MINDQKEPSFNDIIDLEEYNKEEEPPKDNPSMDSREFFSLETPSFKLALGSSKYNVIDLCNLSLSYMDVYKSKYNGGKKDEQTYTG